MPRLPLKLRCSRSSISRPLFMRTVACFVIAVFFGWLASGAARALTAISNEQAELFEVGWPNVLKYLLPALISFLLIGACFFYRRQLERKQLRAAIAESQNLLLSVMDAAPLRIFWKDRNFRYLGCNMAFARDAGMADPKDLIGKDDYQMAWAAQAAACQADDRAVMASGIPRLSYDEQLTTSSGQTIWLRRSKVPLKNAHLETIGLVGIYEEVTERKRLEKSTEDAALYNRSLIEASLDAFVVLNAQGTITDCNKAAEQLTGIARTGLIGSDGTAYLTDPESGRDSIQQVLAQGFDADHSSTIRHVSGKLIDVLFNSSEYRDADGKVLGIFAVVRDMTERKRLENKLKESLIRLQSIASRLPGVVYQFRLRPDGSSCIPYASDAMHDVFRVKPKEVREDAAKIFAAIHPDDHDGVLASIQLSGYNLTPWQHEFRVKFADGTVRWLLGNSMPQIEEDRAVLWHGFITDITERKITQQKLAESESNLQSIIENEPECVTIVDAQGRLKQMNPAGLAMIDADTLAQVAGKPVLELIAPEYHAAFKDLHQRVMGGEKMLLEFESIGLKGRRRWMETHAVTVQNHNKMAHLAVTRDITLRKQMDDKVHQFAFHDVLTNLPNRRLLIDHLTQAMAATKRSGRHGALMFLDLDNFKPLNDTHGHDVGDLLLIEVARRLKSCVREIDTVARMGGDEFVVLLSDLHEDKAASTSLAEIVAEKIRIKLAEPYFLTIKREGKIDPAVEHHCTASIGVVVFANDEASQDDILNSADAAMYQAKVGGRNAVRIHAANALSDRLST